MAEYIEKQAARPDEFCVGVSCQECPFLKDPLYGGCRVDDFIMALPPADVRPVVRGKWIKVGGFYTPGGDPVWECSECGKGRHVYGVEHGTYGADISDGQWVACPNCRADMMGGDAE